MRVVAGESRREYSDSPINVGTPTYSNIAELCDDEIKGDADEAACDELFQISDFLAAAVAKCYGARETHTHLYFALTDFGYILLDSSSITTVSDPVAPSLTETIAQQIRTELTNFPAQRNVCCTRAADCGPPKYKIGKLSVVLYRLSQAFPTVGERLLYEMVTNRIEDATEETVCCVRCYHSYVASDRLFECALRPEAITFERPPQPFQPLVAVELNARDKRPLTSTVAGANAAHRYLLNIVQSPYGRAPWALAAVPKQEVRKREPVSAVPKWAERLCRPMPLNWPQRKMRTSFSGFEVPPPVEQKPPFQPGVTFSLELAPRLYKAMPFNLAMIDPKRKEKLHANVEPPLERLSGFGA
jgi:hypothetical protein